MSKTQFEMVTRFDEPYCIEICHERKEYARRNRNYARLFSTGDHFFMPFPVKFDGKCWKVYRLFFVPAPEVAPPIHNGG